MTFEIGTKIRQLRLRRGMTQEQLGAELGLSAQAISKWEAAATMPDISLLPRLSVLFGVTIDELFSLTDDSRMDRIASMLEDERFLPDHSFADTEQYLKEKALEPSCKARAVLLLAQLYVKRANEFRELAAPLARQALLLNPDAKDAHKALFDAEGVPASDWNCRTRWKLIAFYQDFLQRHPENPRSYLWLMDLLLQDGRTREASAVLAEMDQLEHTYRTDLYAGLIAQAEGNLPQARAYWTHMTEEFPDLWLAWFSLGDCLASRALYDEAIPCYERALALQPSPKYTDYPEALAEIAEIQGDDSRAIAQWERCIQLMATQWDLTEGEVVDRCRREIARLREKQAAR